MNCTENTAPNCDADQEMEAPEHPTGIYVLTPQERQALQNAWVNYVMPRHEIWWQSLAMARDSIFDEVFCSAVEGLIDHLRCVRHSTGHPMLPSLIVHRLWAAWEDACPADAARVVMRCAGRMISSRDCEPAISASMTNDQVRALASSWVGAYRAAGLKPGVTAIPPLFHIDSRYSVPGGWLFVFKRERLLAFQITEMGDIHGYGHTQAWLAPEKLVALGLISRDEQAHSEVQRELRRGFWSWFFANLLHEGQHAAELDAFNATSKSHPGKKKAA